MLDRKKIGKNNKTKGAKFERDVAKKFQAAYGIDLVRTPQSGGFAKSNINANAFRGDIAPLNQNIDFKLHIECKNCKNIKLPAWIKQAEDDAPDDKMPVVIHHCYGTSKDYITFNLDDFFTLVKKDDIIN